MFINVECIDGIRRERVYSIDELSYLGKLLECRESVKRDVRYLEIPAAFDIETTTIAEDVDQYKLTDDDIYKELHGIRLYYTDSIRNDIADFDSIRKRLFGQIILAKKEKTNIDSVYSELAERYPYYFPADVVNVSDMLMHIVRVYEQNKPEKDDFRPYAFMYHWQFCLDDEVVFGRTWEEFQQLISTLSERMNLSSRTRLVVWCHNLPFEIQFARRFLHITGMFCKDDHKPLKVETAEGIEFRDSYALSNMSLERFCKNERGVVHYKLSGDDYDYDKRRTAITSMSEKELAYCYNDVRGLCECIRSRMQDDTLASMPMTSTGYVRRLYRNSMRTNPDNWHILQNGKLTPGLYNQLRRGFRGGDCHANIRYVNQTLHDIQSFDIASSYPGVLMTEKYPMGKWTKVSTKYYKRHREEIAEEFCSLIEVRFENIRYTGSCGNPYISESKCDHVPVNRHNKTDIVLDNGRIGYANWLEMTITDVDLDIIKNEYMYNKMYIRNAWICRKDYLPEEFRQVLRDLFTAKTQLKGIPEQEYEYNKSKNRINASYGMTVQRVDRDNWEYVDGEYTATAGDLAELLDKYYKSRNSFLRYEWGVWCTAYARQRLRMGLAVAGRRAVYCDTDSVKADGDFIQAFEELNRELREKAEAAGAYADDRKGIRHYMGVFEYEGTYDEFRTLGAKKYGYKKDGEITTTIAGVNKQRGSEFFTEYGLDALHNGTVIPKSGHLVAYYNDDDIHRITVDHCEMTTASNIALVDDTYTIGMTGEYMDLLEKALKNVTDLYYN